MGCPNDISAEIGEILWNILPFGYLRWVNNSQWFLVCLEHFPLCKSYFSFIHSKCLGIFSNVIIQQESISNTNKLLLNQQIFNKYYVAGNIQKLDSLYLLMIRFSIKYSFLNWNTTVGTLVIGISSSKHFVKQTFYVSFNSNVYIK